MNPPAWSSVLDRALHGCLHLGHALMGQQFAAINIADQAHPPARALLHGPQFHAEPVHAVRHIAAFRHRQPGDFLVHDELNYRHTVGLLSAQGREDALDRVHGGGAHRLQAAHVTR